MDKPPEGLAAVFLSNRSALLRFAQARLGGSTEAEDVMQDVWLKLDSGDLGPVAEPLAYIYRMIENAVRDRHRSEARRRAREANWMSDAPAAPENGSDNLSPERIAIERDRLRRVEQRLDELPERTRDIFCAFRIEGSKQSDIATDLNISLSAVEKHLQRAYKAVIEARHDDDAEMGAE